MTLGNEKYFDLKSGFDWSSDGDFVLPIPLGSFVYESTALQFGFPGTWEDVVAIDDVFSGCCW